ncbi:hypothetical protein SAVIM40S_05240 [Streptomyces avidinii]
MPRPARSLPSVRARLWTAAFVAAYTGATARPRCRVHEALSTIDPPPAASSSGSTFWTVKNTPLKLTSTLRSKSRSVTSPLRWNTPTPALANTPSRRPCRSRIRAARRSRSVRLAESARTVNRRAPWSDALSNCSAARSRRASSRPVMTIWAPASRSRRAVARPIPLVPPVIRTTRSWKPVTSLLLSVMTTASPPVVGPARAGSTRVSRSPPPADSRAGLHHTALDVQRCDTRRLSSSPGRTRTAWSKAAPTESSTTS